MDVLEYIKLCCVKKKMTMADLARMSGQSPQNLHNKYTRNTFKVSELEKIAAAFDATVQIKFIDNNTGEPII